MPAPKSASKKYLRRFPVKIANTSPVVSGMAKSIANSNRSIHASRGDRYHGQTPYRESKKNALNQIAIGKDNQKQASARRDVCPESADDIELVGLSGSACIVVSSGLAGHSARGEHVYQRFLIRSRYLRGRIGAFEASS